MKARVSYLSRAHPRETIGVSLLGFAAAAAALAAAAQSTPDLAARDSGVAPPAPPPLLIRQLAPEQAVQVNQDIPLTSGPNPAAKPFVFKGSAAARSQALECLANAVYYEAGSQDDDGQRAVAQVVLNRVRHAAFPARSAASYSRVRPGRQAANSPSPATARSIASPAPTAGAAPTASRKLR